MSNLPIDYPQAKQGGASGYICTTCNEIIGTGITHICPRLDRRGVLNERIAVALERIAACMEAKL